MRLLRVLVVATSFAALLAQPSAAQEGRPFKDAWFWGLKGGVLNYSSSAGTDNAGAPMLGVEWLITRTKGGLYASVDQSFFNSSSFYREPPVAGDPLVDISHVRRYSLAALVFPMQTPTLHPYAGFGVSLHQVVSANLRDGITIPALRAAAADSVQNKRAALAPMFMLGAQKRLPRFSVFAHGTGNFIPRGFLLRYEKPKRALEWSLEAGIRYNVGASIDRQR
jgi:hypothetical protein